MTPQTELITRVSELLTQKIKNYIPELLTQKYKNYKILELLFLNNKFK